MTMTNLERWAKFYDPSNITRAFWAWGGFIYSIVFGRHIGTDYAKDADPSYVPALDGGTVIYSRTHPILGGLVIIHTGHRTHPYIGYGHLFNGDMLRYGQSVTLGGHVGRMAEPDESTGSGWDGRHLHVVVATQARYIHTTDGDPTQADYIDPAVYAANLIAAATATAERITNQEDNMTQQVRLNRKHVYTIGSEYISHNNTALQADIARKVNSVADEQHDLTEAQFREYLNAMGVPHAVVNFSTGAVLNPQSGKFEGNGTWSRHRQILAKLGVTD